MEYTELEAELIVAKLKGHERLIEMISRLMRIHKKIANPPYRSVVIKTLEDNIRRMINGRY